MTDRCDKSMTDEDQDRCDEDQDRCDKSTTGEVRHRRCQRNIWNTCGKAIILILFGAFMCSFIILIKEEKSRSSLRTHIHIQQLHIREDSSNSSDPNTTSIVMDLEFKDPRYSDDLNITLYCASSAIGYCAVPGFDAGSGTAHREAVVVPRGPSWDDAQQKLDQESSVELRVEITTSYIDSKKCRHCSSFREGEKSHCSDCPEPTPVKEVADFLLDASVKVTRIG